MRDKAHSGRLRAFLLDPRLELPLVLIVVAASVLLIWLIMKPALENYTQRVRLRASTREAVSLDEPEERVEESWTLRVERDTGPVLPKLSDTVYGWQSDGTRYYYRNEYGGFATGLQRIDGRLYYFAPDGAMARALGVDVSYYNENVNWEQVAAQGVDFALIRLGGRGWGGGTIYTDTRAQQYLRNARAAGLRVGVYFYSTACTEAEAAQEARFVLGALAGMTLDLPVFIDVEESGEYPEGRADRLSRAERTQMIEAFCRVIETAGYETGVYSGHYFFNSGLYPQLLGDRTIWLANYSMSRYNRVPSGLEYEIWQFTDSGQVKGIPGYVDLNVIF